MFNWPMIVCLIAIMSVLTVINSIPNLGGGNTTLLEDNFLL
jgi:hypothetical protein